MPTSLHPTATAVDLVNINPNNLQDLERQARAVRCRPDGTAGTLRITTAAGNVRNTYIEAGEILEVSVVRVWVAGTSATGLEAMI